MLKRKFAVKKFRQVGKMRYLCEKLKNKLTLMLTKFAITNFRGFPRRMEWDLSSPKNYSFNQDAIKDGVIKNGIVFGKNGSGKSNFSIALFDIVNHLSQKWKKQDYYDNFVYAGNATAPVVFEYWFTFGGKRLFYCYSKNKQGQLLQERLDVDGKTVVNRDKTAFAVDTASFALTDEVKQRFTEKETNISVINYILSSLPLEDGHYLRHLQDFVNSMLWFRGLKQNEFIGLNDVGGTNLFNYIIENDYVKRFEQFLLDVSGQQFELHTFNNDNQNIYCKIDDSYIHFSEIESTGTTSLTLLFYWLTRMETASLVFIDEFDAFYHYELSYNICKQLFKRSQQIFLTSHDTFLISNDLLRPDCYFLIQDNQIKPLSDCTEKELRFGHNIEKMFRGGAFKV